MREREKNNFTDNDILILSRTGKKLTRAGVQKMISKYSEKMVYQI